MNGHKTRLWNLVILCLWELCFLAACGGPVAARGGEPHGAHRAKQITWPAHYFAPYNNDASRQTDLVALSQASGARFFTLAFIESSKGKTCRATWNTRQPVGAWMSASIEALRANGGDVRIAFGGSSNSELAVTCHTLSALEAQYRAVIDTYNLSHLDFDIEGKTLKNAQANERRNQAIAALQTQYVAMDQDLDISYTLPVEVTGLTRSGLNLLRDAVRRGVRIGAVNLMVMDYYSKHAPGDQMAQNAIAAAQSVVRQLQQIYPARNTSQLWGMLGLTPMIGVNDDLYETFTMQNAQSLISFAEQQQIPLLAFWSLGRDRPCASDQTAPHGCSGVEQQPYDYALAFAAFGK